MNLKQLDHELVTFRKFFSHCNEDNSVAENESKILHSICLSEFLSKKSIEISKKKSLVEEFLISMKKHF